MRSIYGIGLTSLLLGLWVIHTCSAALPAGAHNLEEDQASKSPHMNKVFNRAIRGPQNNAPAPRLNAQAKPQSASPKTTPNTPAPVENDKEPESDGEQQEGAEDESSPVEESVSSTTSSTEAPRRRTTGSVRPIQSREDFFAKLKKRREQYAQHGYTVAPPPSTTTTEKSQVQPKINQNGRKPNTPKTPIASADQAGSQKKFTSSRRTNYKATVSTTPLPPPQSNEAIPEESNLAPQSSRSRIYPKNRKSS